ncbi:hypothetical protein QBC32DRAFT_67918 [Pseudoneurospora amorphoporcata]|uniref:Uncharacterized protein n=1 Tax=Pseudoneurospora amorphoporcata TaxID=241081 RepID=A0AAN6P1N5_9PEZI|nr:hypothetical protein QBC32DRAFT_67918 [Pseudoneurospora amorphoporcata]
MNMRKNKRQTTAGTYAVPSSSVPSVTLTDLDRVVSSVGVIVKGAQDDLKKIDIKDPQGITGILSQLLGNTTCAIQQGTTRIKANNKAMIYHGWGVVGGGGSSRGLYPLGLAGWTGAGNGVNGVNGVVNGLPVLGGLTGVIGLLTSLLNTVTGLLGGLLQIGGGAGSGTGSTTGGLNLGSLTDLANLSNLLGGLTGGVTGGVLPLGDLSNLTGVLSPELLSQLLGGGSSGQPLSLVQDLVTSVLELVTALLGGLTGGAVSGNISGGVTVATS